MRRLLLALVFLSGCCTVPEAYVEAERSVYQTAGAQWILYVEADSELTEREKARKRRLFLAWGVRISAEESQ